MLSLEARIYRALRALYDHVGFNQRLHANLSRLRRGVVSEGVATPLIGNENLNLRLKVLGLFFVQAQQKSIGF